jgi:hypothetical protein
MYRTQGCITFHCKSENITVQVILRLYATLGEVLHGFDMGSSSVAWDGWDVILTGLGKLAAENGVNILNLAARRASLESRIARYFTRGFDIVLPDLNNKLPALRGRLPYLFAAGLKANGGDGCDFTARAIFPTRPGWENNGRARVGERAAYAEDDAPAETSDYALGKVCYGSIRAIYSRNLRAIARDVPCEAALCAYAEYVPGLDFRTVELDLDARAGPDLETPLLPELVRWAFNHRTGAKLNVLKSLLGVELTEVLVREALATGFPPAANTIAQACGSRIRDLKTRPHKIPFAFMKVEDKTALTGPFPRMVMSPADWYGSAYHHAK